MQREGRLIQAQAAVLVLHRFPPVVFPLEPVFMGFVISFLVLYSSGLKKLLAK